MHRTLFIAALICGAACSGTTENTFEATSGEESMDLAMPAPGQVELLEAPESTLPEFAATDLAGLPAAPWAAAWAATWRPSSARRASAGPRARRRSTVQSPSTSWPRPPRPRDSCPRRPARALRQRRALGRHHARAADALCPGRLSLLHARVLRARQGASARGRRALPVDPRPRDAMAFG